MGGAILLGIFIMAAQASAIADRPCPQAPAPVAAGGVRPGDALILSVKLGSIRVERDVRALQPAGPGEHLFVRDREGRVLSVRYESAVR